jgi:hypothetical protein
MFLKDILNQEEEAIRRKKEALQVPVRSLRDIQMEEILHHFEEGNDDIGLKELKNVYLEEQSLHKDFFA